jgi:chitodextrinase
MILRLGQTCSIRLFFSTSDIADVDAANLLAGTWTADISTLTVTGLTASTDYYFNVLVKDEAGNLALYSSATGRTDAAPVYDSPSTHHAAAKRRH